MHRASARTGAPSPAHRALSLLLCVLMACPPNLPASAGWAPQYLARVNASPRSVRGALVPMPGSHRPEAKAEVPLLVALADVPERLGRVPGGGGGSVGQLSVVDAEGHALDAEASGVVATITRNDLPDGRVRVAISYDPNPKFQYVVEYRDRLEVRNVCDHWAQLAGAPHNGGLVLDTNSLPMRFYRLRLIGEPQAGLFALLANDTGASPTDGLTFDPLVSGEIQPTGSVLRLEAALDSEGGPYTTLLDAVTNREAFRLDRDALDRLLGSRLSDGAHELYVRTLDISGAVVQRRSLGFQLDTTPPSLVAGGESRAGQPLDPSVGTTNGFLRLVGKSDPGQKVQLLTTGAEVEADAKGSFVFDNLPLVTGRNAFLLRTVDAACLETVQEYSIQRVPPGPACPFPANLEGWDPTISGLAGAGGQLGRVVSEQCSAILTEGDSFLVGLEHSFVIPSTPSELVIRLDRLEFDTSDAGQMKDAFELALLDSNRRPLVFPVAEGRDGFFNVSEGQDAAAGPGSGFTVTTGSGYRVTTDLSQIPGGTTARLVLRLLNNDLDSGSMVRVREATIQGRSGGFSSRASGPAGRAVAGDSLAAAPAALLPAVVLPRTTSVTSGPRRTLASTASTGPSFPIAGNITAHSNYLVQEFASVPSPSALAYPPEGSRYGDSLYVTSDPTPVGYCLGSPAEVFRIRSDGTSSRIAVFSGSYLEASPWYATFPPLGSAYADFLYISANDMDGNPCSQFDGGGTIVRVFHTGGWTNFTGIGSAAGGPSQPWGIAFGHGSGFGDRLFVANSVGPAGITQVDPLGRNSPYFDTSLNYAPGSVLLGAGPWKDHMIIRGKGEKLVAVDTNLVPSQIAEVPGSRSLRLIANRHFGTNFYYTVDTVANSQSGIYRMGPDGQKELIADGFGSVYEGKGGQGFGRTSGIQCQDLLEFTPDGKTLFVGDWLGNKVYRIVRKVLPADLFLTLNGVPEQAPAGSSVLVSGQAGYTGGTEGRGIVFQVLINGAAVESLDAAGNFFASLELRSGENTFEVLATDSLGISVSNSVSVLGFEGAGATQIGSLVPVTPTVRPAYGRTTFDSRAGTVFSELKLENLGSFPVRKPLYLGITRISDPSVRPSAGEGVSADGTVYFDFSGALSTPFLEPGQSTAFGTLAFANPNRVQFSYELVVMGQRNEAPVMTSKPPLEAFAGRPYRYAAAAFDSDGDRLSFELLEAPAGMRVENASGLVSWDASGSLGAYAVKMAARDGRGGSVEQRFVLNVVAAPSNRPPSFVSIPSTVVQIPEGSASSETYSYQPVAADPDGDTVSFSLVEGPASMTSDPASGQLRWTPTAEATCCAHPVTLRAVDGRGGVAEQTFSLCVMQESDPKPDSVPAPWITSRAPRRGVVGRPLQFFVRAQAPGNPALTFRLGANPPEGARIRTSRGFLGSVGVFDWTPDGSQLGMRSIEWTVADPSGKEAIQRFDLEVVASAENSPPDFAGFPRTVTGVGRPYTYAIQMSDPDDDPVSLTLLDGPPGMVLTNTVTPLREGPLLSWVPQSLGTFPVVLTASDGLAGGSSTQAFAIVVTSVLSNQPPVIAADPGTSARVGRLYTVNLSGTDPDGDAMVWRLAQAPPGASLDPGSGQLRWQPTQDHVGTQYFEVLLEDGLGASTSRRFPVVATCGNRAPQITSTPPVEAHVEGLYVYPARALDPEGDDLTWSLADPWPVGMSIDARTGMISWTPSTTQAGAVAIGLLVKDSDGGMATQRYTVHVSATRGNHSPLIASSPVRFATVGRPYVYAVRALDPDLDTLQLQAPLLPPGAVLTRVVSGAGEINGQVIWTPSVAQVGSRDFQVLARDPSRASMSQQFSVVVRTNLAPVITSAPRTNAVLGQVFQYDCGAYDPEGDAITFSLTPPVPGGMQMDGSGRISWEPAAEHLGVHSITVGATDAFGATSRQIFPVLVTTDQEPPQLALQIISGNNLYLDEEVALPVGTTVRFRFRDGDNVGIADRQLSVGDLPLPLDGSGETSRSFDTPFLAPVVGTVRDVAGNVAQATRRLRIYDPKAQNQLTITIHSPLAETNAMGLLPIVASLTNSVALATCTVDYAALADVNLDNIAESGRAFTTLTKFTFPADTRSLAKASLANFDPTRVESDTYLIRVWASDINGNLTYEGVLVNVQGNLKFGEFRMEFTDLTVPVSGVPMTVKRVYDSRASARQKDLGYGWTLGVQDPRIQATLKKGTMHVGSRVFITTPDGRRVGYTIEPEIQWAFPPLVLARIRLRPDPGVYDQLEPVAASFWLGPDGHFDDGLGFAEFLDVPVNPSRYRLTTKEGLVYEYDRTQGLQQVRDRAGNRLMVDRAGIQHLPADSEIVDQSIRFERDPQGRIRRVIDPAGNAIAYAYDAAGDLVSVTDQATNITKFAYHPARAHYLARIVDPLGREAIRTEYDDDGRLKSITDPLGNKVSGEFDPETLFGSFTDANGHVTYSRYDERGNETAKWIEGVYTNSFAYDANNNLTNTVDGRGYVTRRAYDSRGNLTNIVDALTNSTSITYNDLSKPTSVTDALKRSMHFDYSQRGDLTNAVNALGVQASFERDAQGRATGVTDFNGRTTRYDYTGGCSCGKPSKVTNPDGTWRSYEYNALGQITHELNELGQETLYHYDDAGRLSWVRDAETNFTQYLYRAGLKIAEIDPLNRTNWFGYDDANRLVSQTNALGGVVRFEYDQGTNRTAVIDPVNNVTRFYYDQANRLTIQVDAWGRTNSYSYDPAGNRTEAVDRNGRKRTFGYDGLNRRTNELWWEGTNLAYNIEFGFNALGVMTNASDPSSHLAFEFDDLNRLQKAIQTGVPNLAEFVLHYGYDAMTNVVSVKDNWGVEMVSGYDVRNRLTNRIWQGGGLRGARVNFAHDAVGNRTNILRFADAAATQLASQSVYAYNGLGAVTHILHANGVAVPLAEYHYQRDAAQQILQRVLNGQAANYNYDSAGQLTNVLYSAGQTNESYRYDDNRNRIVEGYVVSSNNQIVADGTFTYGYDFEGSLVARTNIPTGATTAYRYDHRNRLTSVVDKDAGGTVTQTVEFTYDALNRRIAKSVNGAVVRFLLNQSDIWADADGGGNITARYLLGNRVDEMLARYRPGETLMWYLTDNLGTVRDLADSTGAVVNHVSFDSFGQILAQSAPAVGDRFLYTGREWDSENGLYFFRTRHYSPRLGRFLSEDTIGLNDGYNLYAYVGNTPTIFTDPYGRSMVGYMLEHRFSTAMFLINVTVTAVTCTLAIRSGEAMPIAICILNVAVIGTSVSLIRHFEVQRVFYRTGALASEGAIAMLDGIESLWNGFMNSVGGLFGAGALIDFFLGLAEPDW